MRGFPPLNIANDSATGLESLQNDPPPTASFHIGPSPSLDLSTLAIHGDDNLNQTADVAPALHVSTTFRYNSDPDKLIVASDLKVFTPLHFYTSVRAQTCHQGPPPTDSHVYSRHTAPSSTRLETLLAPLLRASCVTYTSGCAALHAAYVLLNPRVVSIGGGYHGSHGVLRLQSRVSGVRVVGLDCAAEEVGEGDVVHLETPVNPTGEAFDIRHYADKAHSRGAYLLVDSTFGPPGLQDPFEWGADIVLHSGTKFLAGHSDMLCGILACKSEDVAHNLREDRTYLGSVLGSLESWLGVRSIRTLALRVQRQSENAAKIVEWLHAMLNKEADANDKDVTAVQSCVAKIQHASLQEDDMAWLKEQMPNGFGAVFALTMKDEGLARALPSKTNLFHHATSLGGVESLIEWRAMSDTTVDRRVVRISCGIEATEDLKSDLSGAFQRLLKSSQ